MRYWTGCAAWRRDLRHPEHENLPMAGELSYPLYITHYPLMYMQMSWVEANKAAPLWMHIAVNVGVIFLSIVLSRCLLKLYDEPVREWLKEHWLKRAKYSFITV